MSDIIKAPKQPHRFEGWPLLALLAKYQSADQDERGVQHLTMVFQLHVLRALYGVVRADLGDHALLLPMVMIHHGEGAEDGTTIWIGSHDPVGCGMGEMYTIYAKSTWASTRGDGGGGIKIEAGWDQDDTSLSDPVYVRQSKAAAQWIVDNVSPTDFNTVAMKFWGAIGLHELFTTSTPARWFGIISGNPDYDRRSKASPADSLSHKR